MRPEEIIENTFIRYLFYLSTCGVGYLAMLSYRFIENHPSPSHPNKEKEKVD